NGPWRRALCSWIARATSSLPVPVSPFTSTVECVGATVAMARRTSRRAALSPIIVSSTGSGLGPATDRAEHEPLPDRRELLVERPPRGRDLRIGEPRQEGRGPVIGEVGDAPGV